MHSQNLRKWCKFCTGSPLPEGVKGPEETKYEWVTVKEEMKDGRPFMPQGILDSTANRIYDPDEHTDFKLMIRTGAGPEGELISNYKLYSITKFHMEGFRLRAKATIELPVWRQHEEEWFEAYHKARVEISDPGVAGSISKYYYMKVTETDFSKTQTYDKKEQSLVASLTMKETRWSMIKRQKGRYLAITGTVIVAVIGAAVGAAITILFG